MKEPCGRHTILCKVCKDLDISAETFFYEGYAASLDKIVKMLTNQSLRDRLSIGKNNAAVASRIISDTVSAGFIKAREEQYASTKFREYVPYYV